MSHRFTKYKPNLMPTVRELVSVAQRNGIALPSIFLAIYARLYSAFKNRIDANTSERENTVVIGVYMANRDQGVDNLATSPTINLLPLRVDTQLAILESAGLIQRDLAQIGEVENISVGLWDIAEWTGVKVDTFVNYLRVPGEGDEFRRDVRGSDETAKTSNSEERKRDTVAEAGDVEFVVPRGLRDNVVKDTYLPSIDVEVAFRDGALDVGIFGPTELMDEQAAEDIMTKLKEELLSLVEG